VRDSLLKFKKELEDEREKSDKVLSSLDNMNND
jgi:hypothetical protein